MANTFPDILLYNICINRWKHSKYTDLFVFAGHFEWYGQYPKGDAILQGSA